MHSNKLTKTTYLYVENYSTLLREIFRCLNVKISHVQGLENLVKMEVLPKVFYKFNIMY